jgi:hypothetical protein
MALDLRVVAGRELLSAIAFDELAHGTSRYESRTRSRVVRDELRFARPESNWLWTGDEARRRYMNPARLDADPDTAFRHLAGTFPTKDTGPPPANPKGGATAEPRRHWLKRRSLPDGCCHNISTWRSPWASRFSLRVRALSSGTSWSLEGVACGERDIRRLSRDRRTRFQRRGPTSIERSAGWSRELVRVAETL